MPYIPKSRVKKIKILVASLIGTILKEHQKLPKSTSNKDFRNFLEVNIWLYLTSYQENLIAAAQPKSLPSINYTLE